METIHAGLRRSLPPVPRAAGTAPDRDGRMDAGQRFVAHLRGAAPEFAAAAGAQSAVVREVVPPARHRRARCRVVLRDLDGAERDLTFLGPTGSPALTRPGFDADILRWLASGHAGDGSWLVPDPEASGGTAIDLTAWRTTG
ncbi:hypothetical protein DQ241_04500 [Blastococcus sp. TF02A-30]|nr:hypothetical protein DQ241_04500 [Blastococcus sp. TF02A-30]